MFCLLYNHYSNSFLPTWLFLPSSATCLISTALASIGPAADLKLSNGDVAPDGFTRQAVLVNRRTPGSLIVENKQ
ncbi:hypothetical protein B0H19DRAFT_1148448 [Mycena capillaripes]|nr:hypothetical protein B0H19DRAFT_1148448 [Mycena capillaripes]